MAAKVDISQHNGSDVVFDVCCSICRDEDKNNEGRFYCPKCSQYFCDSCVLTHNRFLKDHSVTAKGEGNNWPVTKLVDDTLELYEDHFSQTVADSLELCEEHATEKLTMFCEDHEKLLCQFCHVDNHRQCSQVVILADKINSTTRRMDVAQMAASINTLLKCFEDMVEKGEQQIMFLQTSYESALEEILDFRRQINKMLDQTQENTVRNLEKLHFSLKTSLENEKKRNEEFISRLNVYNTTDTYITSTKRSFIMYRKCVDHSDAADVFLQNVSKNADIEFERNTGFEKLLACLSDLGNITSREVVSRHQNIPVSIKDKSLYNVRTAIDKSNCSIKGICESSNREFVIADYNNKCVKVLDQAFNLLDAKKLHTWPWSICNISSDEMAITVSDGSSVNEILFLKVDKGKIARFNQLQMNHRCYGIAHHMDDLFVTSGTALYQYKIDGSLVKKLYEVTSECHTGVGVSPDGQRIYLTHRHNGKLRTLNRDGEVTATIRDPSFKHSCITCNIHVGATSQVFVFGETTVSQVDSDGTKILNTIDIDIPNPVSVYFNEELNKMVIGMGNNDNVIELKIKVF